MSVEITLYYTASVDGFVADSLGNTPWSSASWAAYVAFCSRCRNLIMGRRTYDLFIQDASINQMPFDNLVVVSRSMRTTRSDFIQAQSPQDAVAKLHARGVSEALLIGGPTTASAFLAQRLLSRIRLDVEPKLLGSGLAMFQTGGTSQELKLCLVESEAPGNLVFTYEVTPRALQSG
jgi:dihydrofolate reductase